MYQNSMVIPRLRLVVLFPAESILSRTGKSGFASGITWIWCLWFQCSDY